MISQAITQTLFKKNLQKGDKLRSLEDFSDLYDQYHRQVRSVLYRMGAKEELDDLVQEVFLKVWQALPTFKGKSRFSTWIYRIAMNTAIDRFRKLKTRGGPAEQLDEEKTSGNEHYDAQVENTENQQLISDALGELNEEQRSVLVLHLMEGKKLKEVAKILELPLGTVKSRLHYAKQSMQGYLSDRGVCL
ncbi:MAG: sigma-70 family RNA polymerase sigma factor [Deltaproteobacteria bacterium]|nr:sigma-70 family RNA polymerase sigma factor [Deltaproteobacteria bacterium]